MHVPQASFNERGFKCRLRGLVAVDISSADAHTGVSLRTCSLSRPHQHTSAFDEGPPGDDGASFDALAPPRTLPLPKLAGNLHRFAPLR